MTTLTEHTHTHIYTHTITRTQLQELLWHQRRLLLKKMMTYVSLLPGQPRNSTPFVCLIVIEELALLLLTCTFGTLLMLSVEI